MTEKKQVIDAMGVILTRRLQFFHTQECSNGTSVTPLSFREYLKFYSRTAGLVVAMCAGTFIPSAEACASWIPLLVALMLFLASLDLHVGPNSFRGNVWRVLGANLVIAFAGFFVLLPVDRTLALVAFLTGVTPTAISAPVIIGFLDGDVEYVVASVLITNLSWRSSFRLSSR